VSGDVAVEVASNWGWGFVSPEDVSESGGANGLLA